METTTHDTTMEKVVDRIKAKKDKFTDALRWMMSGTLGALSVIAASESTWVLLTGTKHVYARERLIVIVSLYIMAIISLIGSAWMTEGGAKMLEGLLDKIPSRWLKVLSFVVGAVCVVVLSAILYSFS